MLIDLKTQQGSQVFKSKNQILFVFVSLSSCLFFLNMSTCLYWGVIYKLCISLSVFCNFFLLLIESFMELSHGNIYKSEQ